MKLKQYLNEENIIQKALNLPEPEIGGDYAPEKIKRYLNVINQALNAMKNKKENEINDSIVQDLRDKKKKWTNIDKETKPIKVKQDIPPEGDAQQEQPPPE